MTDQTSGNASSSVTALYTSQVWIAAGFAHADAFDSLRGRLYHLAIHSVYRLFSSGSSVDPDTVLVTRHKAFDAAIKQQRSDYVLEVAAGLSPRGWSMAEANPDMTYVEGDLPDLVAAKRAWLDPVQLPQNYHLMPLDVLDATFPDRLPAATDRQAEAVVATEGLMDYLTHEQKRIAWSNIHRALTRLGGGSYFLELFLRRSAKRQPRSTIARVSSGALEVLGKAASLILGLNSDEASARFEQTDDALQLLKECGFRTATVRDVRALVPDAPANVLEMVPWAFVEARV